MENKYNVDEELFKTLMKMPRLIKGTVKLNIKNGAPGQALPGMPGPGGPKCPGNMGPGGHGPMGRPAPMGPDGPKCPGGPNFGGHGPAGGQFPNCPGGPVPGGPMPGGHGPMPGGPVPGGPMPGGHGPGQGDIHAKRVLAREMILVILAKHESGVRQKTLAEEMKVNPSSMSEFIDRLESTGYITRTVDPEDKRATLISLTEKGKARAAELEDERVEHLSKIFCNLTNEEKHELIRLLNKLYGKEAKAAAEEAPEATEG